jgi:hypothetical protein
MRHEHEQWQIREDGDGGTYCAACGATLGAATNNGRSDQCCTLCPEIAKFAHRRLPLRDVLDFAALDHDTLLATLIRHGHTRTARQYGAIPHPIQTTIPLGERS